MKTSLITVIFLAIVCIMLAIQNLSIKHQFGELVNLYDSSDALHARHYQDMTDSHRRNEKLIWFSGYLSGVWASRNGIPSSQQITRDTTEHFNRSK